MSAGSLGMCSSPPTDERIPRVKHTSDPDASETVRRFIREMEDLRKHWKQQDAETDELAAKTFATRISGARDG